MKHVRIVFDEEIKRFRICLVIEIDAIIAKLKDTDQAEKAWEDETLHTTATLEGAVVHAYSESGKLGRRLGIRHALPVVIDGSVARKCEADGYDGDPTLKDK